MGKNNGIKGLKDTTVSMTGSIKSNEPNVFKKDIDVVFDEFKDEHKKFIKSVDDNAMGINKSVITIETPDIYKPTNEKLIATISSEHHASLGYPLNVINQDTIFDSNVFTINSERLMQNFKQFGNPINPIMDYTKLMDITKPFNITRWQPAIGKFLLLGISDVSPLVLSGVTKVDGPDIDKYTSPFKYFIVGVFHQDMNSKFGMRALYKVHSKSEVIGREEDPMSAYNLSISYKDPSIKKGILENKDKAAVERISTRMLILVDEMEISGYTY